MADAEAGSDVGAKNPLATALGFYYPRHYVVAVIDDPAKAIQALAALREAGFDDAAAELCPGPDFLTNYRGFVDGQNLFQRASRLFPVEEEDAVKEYLAEAERGASFVTVYTPKHDERDRARDLLKQHGGHAMRHYGERTITDL
jgi:hypothetical protein